MWETSHLLFQKSSFLHFNSRKWARISCTFVLWLCEISASQSTMRKLSLMLGPHPIWKTAKLTQLAWRDRQRELKIWDQCRLIIYTELSECTIQILTAGAVLGTDKKWNRRPQATSFVGVCQIRRKEINSGNDSAYAEEIGKQFEHGGKCI